MKRHARAVQGKSYFDAGLNHKYLFFRRTKIIATIGPSSSSPKIIREMILNGLNVARINFSHGSARDHLRTIQLIRNVSEKLGRPVAIMGDLCGPKIRVGKFAGDSAFLKEKSTVLITVKPVPGNESVIPCQYKKLVSEVSVNTQILLDDGNIELKVTKKGRNGLHARVVRGGILKNDKGMNLINARMKIPSLTAKDRKDLSFCIEGQVDYIALSFVRTHKDVVELKNILRRRKADIAVIAKIEKPEALKNIHDILQIADGIMIARGDLGVELPAKKVPFIQNKLIEACIQNGKPVIVATQMLESMIDNTRPTRAEVTDVSAACLSSADAVMLSAETASGKYPVEALKMMDSILRQTEAYQYFTYGGMFRDVSFRGGDTTRNAVSAAIAQLSRDLKVRCIIVPTRSGSAAYMVSSDRPSSPVIALTSSDKVLKRLLMIWGVQPYHTDSKYDIRKSLAFAEAFMKRLKLAGSGDYLLIVTKTRIEKTDNRSITVHKIA